MIKMSLRNKKSPTKVGVFFKPQTWVVQTAKAEVRKNALHFLYPSRISNPSLSNKKSQVWYTDFMVGLLIFIIALTIYYEFSTNLSKQEEGLLDEMLADAKSISSSLVSAGYPPDWNSGNVERIGITNNDQRIDNEKLEEFYYMPYNQMRRLFGTRFDFFVFFEDKEGNITTIEGGEGIGHPAVTNYTIKTMAYYFQETNDMFMVYAMRDKFNADIYFKDGDEGEAGIPLDGDINDFLNNLSSYDFVIIEDPHFKRSQSDDKGYSIYSVAEIKSMIENYVSAGNVMFITEHVEFKNKTADVYPVLDVVFGGGGDNPATVLVEDEYLNFSIGDEIYIKQRLSMQNTSATTNFVVIASYDDDEIAIAKWYYGFGLVYFFSDFDVDDGHLFKGRSDISLEVEGAVDKLLERSGGLVDMNYKKLVKITRMVVYNSDSVKMVVYVWE